MTEQVDAAFVAGVGAMAEDGVAPASLGEHLTAQRAVDLFEAQVTSRHLDLAARWLRSQGKGFYTIGSSGHEGNAAVAAALRPTDPALLHYRSGGFYLARAQQVPGADAVRDVLLGLVAAADEPIAGGRHKVFGQPRPRGDPADLDDRLAPAARARRRVRDRPRRQARRGERLARATRSWSAASATPRRTTRPRRARSTPRCRSSSRGIPVPLLLVCEDNGLGISVPTPPGWVAAGLRPPARPALPRRRRHRPASPCVEAATRAGRLGARRTAGRRSCTCARCG